MAEAGDRGAVRPRGETRGRHEWASGQKASGGEVTRGRGRDAGDVAEADVVEPVQHSVVQAAPDAGPAPGREPAVSRRLRYAEAERQPSPDTAGDQMADGRRQRLIRCALRSATLRPHLLRRDQRLRDLPQTVQNDPTRRSVWPIRHVRHMQRGDGEVGAATLAGGWAAGISPWCEPPAFLDHQDRRCSAPGGWSPRSVRSARRRPSQRGLRGGRAAA